MLKKFASYYRPNMKLFVADMACALLLSACNMFYPMITRSMINDYVPNRNLQMLIFLSLALLGIYLMKAWLTWFIQYYGHMMGVRIQIAIRRDAFAHLQKLPFSYFDKNKSGTIMSRIINDTFEISELAHHGPENLFISTVTIPGAFYFLSNIYLPLTLIIFAFVPILAAFAVYKRIALSKTSMTTRVEVGEVNADLENSIAGVRISRAFSTEEQDLAKFERGNQAYGHAKSYQYKAMGEFFSGTGIIMDLLTLVTLFAGGWCCLHGKINFGDFTAYLLFVGQFTDPIKKFINFIEQLQNGITGFQRVSELMDVPPEEETPGATELEQVDGKLQFEDVTFRYDADTCVLSHLNLEIEAGQTVALVGPSGGGKSTLCHLIPRFYELESGQIKLDGTDIRKYTRRSLRREIGIVQQDAFLFTGTIRENIAYGNMDATDEQIIAAAKSADIHDFIVSLPQGYDTFVGERGVTLSGGQKQRISIARIFLKNPSVLILDEATSALDNITEHHIQTSLDALSKGRTTLVVAHRLTTIRHADQIIVLTADGIMESGTHEELLKQGGMYAGLWASQQSDN